MSIYIQNSQSSAAVTSENTCSVNKRNALTFPKTQTDFYYTYTINLAFRPESTKGLLLLHVLHFNFHSLSLLTSFCHHPHSVVPASCHEQLPTEGCRCSFLPFSFTKLQLHFPSQWLYRLISSGTNTSLQPNIDRGRRINICIHKLLTHNNTHLLCYKQLAWRLVIHRQTHLIKYCNTWIQCCMSVHHLRWHTSLIELKCPYYLEVLLPELLRCCKLYNRPVICCNTAPILPPALPHATPCSTHPPPAASQCAPLWLHPLSSFTLYPSIVLFELSPTSSCSPELRVKIGNYG